MVKILRHNHDVLGTCNARVVALHSVPNRPQISSFPIRFARISSSPSDNGTNVIVEADRTQYLDKVLDFAHSAMYVKALCSSLAAVYGMMLIVGQRKLIYISP